MVSIIGDFIDDIEHGFDKLFKGEILDGAGDIVGRTLLKTKDIFRITHGETMS